MGYYFIFILFVFLYTNYTEWELSKLHCYSWLHSAILHSSFCKFTKEMWHALERQTDQLMFHSCTHAWNLSRVKCGQMSLIIVGESNSTCTRIFGCKDGCGWMAIIGTRPIQCHLNCNGQQIGKCSPDNFRKWRDINTKNKNWSKRYKGRVQSCAAKSDGQFKEPMARPIKL